MDLTTNQGQAKTSESNINLKVQNAADTNCKVADEAAPLQSNTISDKGELQPRNHEESNTAAPTPPLELHKINIDLYKFYIDLLTKVATIYFAGFAVLLTLITFLYSNTKDVYLILILSLFPLELGAILMYSCHLLEKKVKEYEKEVETVKKQVGTSMGPEPEVLKRLLRTCQISFLMPVLLVYLIIIYFVTFRTGSLPFFK